MVSYSSSNYGPMDWVECCYIEGSGQWYFDGIFLCE